MTPLECESCHKLTLRTELAGVDRDPGSPLWCRHCRKIEDDACREDDEEETTRCWVTLRIAVDVEGEPNDETIREALIASCNEPDGMAFDRDYITWGVEAPQTGAANE